MSATDGFVKKKICNDANVSNNIIFCRDKDKITDTILDYVINNHDGPIVFIRSI